MTREGLDSWLDELRAKVIDWDGTYRPDPDSCRHCRRAHECEARTAMVRRDIGVFLDEQKVRGDLVPATMLSMYRRASSSRTPLRECRRSSGRTSNRTALSRTSMARFSIEEESRRELDTGRAWAALEASGFGDEDFLAVMKDLADCDREACGESGREGPRRRRGARSERSELHGSRGDHNEDDETAEGR